MFCSVFAWALRLDNEPCLGVFPDDECDKKIHVVGWSSCQPCMNGSVFQFSAMLARSLGQLKLMHLLWVLQDLGFSTRGEFQPRGEFQGFRSGRSMGNWDPQINGLLSKYWIIRILFFNTPFEVENLRHSDKLWKGCMRWTKLRTTVLGSV